MGALQMGIGSLAAALVGALSNGTTLPMTGVMAGCALLGLAIFTIGRLVIKKGRKDTRTFMAITTGKAIQ
jgi:DHA1 family bicyclomycin/chloramphenicol resistance-like MFS transporter